jgi:PAS domain S-box-containing protein
MNLLLIENNPEDARRIHQALAECEGLACQTRVADRLSRGLAALSDQAFDVVLLDLTQPECSGLETLEKTQGAVQAIPIIVLLDDDQRALVPQAARQGAKGILFKASICSSRLSKSIHFAVERCKNERAIRFKEKKYRTFFETLKDAYYEVDLSGVFTYVNEATLKHVGCTRQEAIGSNSLNYHYTPEQSKKIHDIFVDIYNTGRSGKILNSAFPRPDGSLISVELCASLIRGDKGNPIGFSGISRDVTEQQAVQKALQASKEKYQNILESIEDTYFEVDLKGRMIFFNRTAEGLYGYSLAELRTMDNRLYMDEENARHVLDAYTRIYATGAPSRDLQYEVVYRDGRRAFVESSISLMKDDAGRPIGFRGVGRDITERKANELELIRAKQKAEEATRAKSEFLANMSHEIRTPMNGIMGMYALLQSTALDAEQSDYVQTGKRCADGLLTVLNDILDFSKIEAGKLELETIDFDLRATIEDLIALPAAQAQEQGLEFVYHIDPEMPSRFMGDPSRLRQILFNLIHNAVKFTQHGEVGLWVALDAQAPGMAAIRFAVKDTGIGIGPDEQARLFTSFQQLDSSTTRRYGGAGLGLVIARRLTELMGGQIGVQSQLGQGSTFYVALPLAKAQGAPQRLPAAPGRMQGKRVLIVDDNQTNLAILEGLLKRWGCDCDCAAGGAMALTLMRAIAKAGAAYDLVITDMQMPEMDGAELGRSIQADPNLKAAAMVMLTSLGLRGDAADMKRIGFAAYLTKPVHPDRLHDCLLTVLGRGPQNPKSKAAPLVTCHSLSEAKRGNTRILLAEDNPINQKIALHLLARFGFQADAVPNGQAAIEALATTPYDLVLMDVEMPEMDGYAATRTIRDPASKVLDHGVPVVAMTARAVDESRKACAAAGMDGYIAKPIQPDALFRVIEEKLRAPIE